MESNNGIVINGGSFQIKNMVSGTQIFNYEKKQLKNLPQYDVIFSFAGENRKIVEEVAAKLGEKKVNVFYDEAEKIELWGKDLKKHFKDIYGSQGLFCIIFLSSYYLTKGWCQYERKIIEEREAHSGNNYILPITLDGTMIAEWKEKKAYLDGQKLSAEQIADYILQKVFLEMKKYVQE